MLERELKVIDIDPLVVSRMLVDHGAVQTFDGYIYDLYFDTPDMVLQPYKYSVRLRFQGNMCIIAFKQKKKDKKTKVMIEKEFVIYDIVSVMFLLLSFGLVPYRCKAKKRVSYSLDGTAFDIDMYDTIPPLLEIEAPWTKTIFSWIKKLQLEHHVQLTVGSQWLMKYYQNMAQYNVDAM
jgi:predicted adenylyl cyclase CyaB